MQKTRFLFIWNVLSIYRNSCQIVGRINESSVCCSCRALRIYSKVSLVRHRSGKDVCTETIHTEWKSWQRSTRCRLNSPLKTKKMSPSDQRHSFENLQIDSWSLKMWVMQKLLQQNQTTGFYIGVFKIRNVAFSFSMQPPHCFWERGA